MSRRWWTLLNVLVDAVVLNAAIVLAFVIRFGLPVPSFNFSAYLVAAVPITVGELIILAAVDLYDPTAERSGPELLAAVAEGVALGGLLLVTLTFLLRAFAFPRLVIVMSLGLQVVFLWGWRMLAARGLKVTWPERRVLLVGSPSDCREIEHRLENMHRWGYRVVGVITADSVGDRLREICPHHIIFATPSRHREALEKVALSRSFQGNIYVVPQLYEMHLGEVNFSLLGDIPLIRLNRAASSSWRRGLKSWVERACAGMLLVLCSPLLVLIALAVLLTSGRPVIFRQTRVGRDFEPFTLYKFRTMIRDAEPQGAVLAQADDPRVTAVGRFLRRTRLDELPQLCNVLKGDMSFVGPRPERPEFVGQHTRSDPLYQERFRVRPGITGLAQVSAPYAAAPAAKLRFDLMYIHHESLSLDLRIILQTLKVVLTGRGAH